MHLFFLLLEIGAFGENFTRPKLNENELKYMSEQPKQNS